jgi:hypothetical protein
MPGCFEKVRWFDDHGLLHEKGPRYFGTYREEKSCRSPHSVVTRINSRFARGYPVDIQDQFEYITSIIPQRRGGETGRRTGLKIQRAQAHAGSIPAPGTRAITGLATAL